MDESMYVLVEVKVDPDKSVESQYEQLAETVSVLKEQMQGKYDVQGISLVVDNAAKEIEAVLNSTRES